MLNDNDCLLFTAESRFHSGLITPLVRDLFLMTPDCHVIRAKSLVTTANRKQF